jgi:RNA polymerase sigma factor (sigma-70 family)
MKNGLPKVLEQLDRAGGGLTDGQLLSRFVAARDEASFTALVRRHGPMVLGVCRRVLRDFHDAEDAFQATFLILARKAASVAKRESVGCWLYAVAFHTALEAARANARRRARERHLRTMPQREVTPTGAPAGWSDWAPLLDQEVNRLSERYRAAVVLCDLEGHPRKEAARLLSVPEGTLSSRLARARLLLAKRLTSRGLALSAGTLAARMAADAAPVPAALAASTARVATLVVAGQLAAASTPAVVLMKGVVKAMLLKKLRLVVGAVMVAAALGAVGLVSRPGDEARAQPGPDPGARARQPGSERAEGGKPLTDLEALRRENEELKINIRVLLKEIAALEAELNGTRGRPAGGDTRPPMGPGRGQPQEAPGGDQTQPGGPGSRSGGGKRPPGPGEGPPPRNEWPGSGPPGTRPPGGDRRPGGPGDDRIGPGGLPPGPGGPVGPGDRRPAGAPESGEGEPLGPPPGGDPSTPGAGNGRPNPAVEAPGDQVPLRGPSRPAEGGRTAGRETADNLSDSANEAQAALNEFREARDPAGRKRAAQALENVLKKLREQLKDAGPGALR